jgi:UDP-N-acetylglucosamine 2-epimerase (non-hydrolysing)
MHPRTRLRVREEGLQELASGVAFLEPVGYLEFLALQEQAAVVLTDSGGIQEETTYLKVPCITLRSNTERPITVTVGTNVLVGQDMEMLNRELHRVLNGDAVTGQVPPLWDGNAAGRIAGLLKDGGF